MVGATRIELATSRPPDVRATAAPSPENSYINDQMLSLSGLGDQIWTGDLAVPNRARYQLRHAQIRLSYHDFSILFDF